ncbi:hypothetical protein ACIBP6_38535 [Nonomuraea terrae]|uniref:hypothetical protein n=1 Tax=Nonomuraea terrae TaxID=2530383 RepID=UPI0037A3BFDA
MKRAALPALAVCAMLVTASPAQARPPERSTLTQHRVVSDQGEACGFPVAWTIDLTAGLTHFFDADGRLLREQAHIKEDNTVQNLATGKVVTEGPDSFTQTTHFDEAGNPTHYVVTGLAVNAGALKDVGRVVLVRDAEGRLDIAFAAGPHPLREATALGDALSAFCGILA